MRTFEPKGTNTSVVIFDPEEARAFCAHVAIYTEILMTRSLHGPLRNMRAGRTSGCMAIRPVLSKKVSTIRGTPWRKWEGFLVDTCFFATRSCRWQCGAIFWHAGRDIVGSP